MYDFMGKRWELGFCASQGGALCKQQASGHEKGPDLGAERGQSRAMSQLRTPHGLPRTSTSYLARGPKSVT